MTRILFNSNSTAAILPTSSSSSTSSAKSSSDAETSQEIDSDFVVILAALLCALICVVGLLSVARCACRTRTTNNRRSGSQTPANRGLKKRVVQSLPKYTYQSSSMEAEKPGDEITSTDCAICLAEYVDGDEIRLLPHCGHRFHVQCVDLWLCSHSSCPSCRQFLGRAWCHKCGELPPVSGISSQTSTPAECSVKGGQHCESSSGSNDFLP